MSGSLRPAFQPTEVALGVGPRAPGLGEVEDRFDTETEIEADGGSAFRLGDMEGALMHWRSGGTHDHAEGLLVEPLTSDRLVRSAIGDGGLIFPEVSGGVSSEAGGVALLRLAEEPGVGLPPRKIALQALIAAGAKDDRGGGTRGGGSRGLRA